MKHILRLLRPKQWTKNLLVFAALIFAGEYKNPTSLTEVCFAFLIMCGLSSAVYIFNDIADKNRDAEHPTKKDRPIASGKVSVTTGIILALILLIAGLSASWMIDPWMVGIAGGYLILQLLYNLSLKFIAVADVFAIATGFVLRAALGAQAIHVPISGWLLFCTAALALMLGFAKRRQEFIAQGDDRTKSRETLSGYNRPVLDIFVAIFAGVAAMSYGIYCIESPTAQTFPGLLLTSPFVLYGIARYMLVVFTKNEGAEPAEILLKDKHIIFSVLGFLATSIMAMAGLVMPLVN